MSKIFLLGDSHIGLGYPNNHEKWKKVHHEYFYDFLLPLLKNEVNESDIIIHLGDLFDNRSVIPIDSLNFGLNIVEQISKIAPLHILVGNHDCWHKSSSEINTINSFKYIPNVFIYDKPTKIEYFGKNLLMMPYIDNKRKQIEIIKENIDCHYLFCHSDLNGAKMHLSSIAHKNHDKIDIEEFSNFKKVYSGHLHIVQNQKNFTFVGNNFEMDRNDINNQKGIFILDVIESTQRFVPNDVSPKFRKLYITKEEHIDELDKVSTKDYIDLFISNSLIIGNRKLRRKLELMLETGSFATVDYVDDIRDEKLKDLSEEDTEKTLEMINESSETGESIKIELEYKDVIREYISNQSYPDEKVKMGILQEFNEIIRIYDENYDSTQE